MRLGKARWTAIALAALLALGARAWLDTLPRRWTYGSLDQFFLFYPAHAHLAAELVAGRLPLWNPLLGLGIAEVADSQFGFFYPPNLIFTVLPAEWGIEVLTVAHVALGAAGGWLLCTATGAAPLGAAVALAALAAGKLYHGLASWTTMLATFAWCPLALFCAYRLAVAPGAGRAVALAVVLGLQLLAGYLQFHLYTLACLPLFMLAARPSVRGFAWLAIAEALAFGLAAVQVVPSLDAVAGSMRSRGALPGWLYEAGRVHLHDFPANLARPILDGAVPVYAGVVVVLLALAAVSVRRAVPLRVPALVLTVAAVILSLGGATPIFPFLWSLPVGHWFAGPYKWTYFFGLGVVLLAAVGAEAVRAGRSRGERLLWVLLSVTTLVAMPFTRAARAIGAVTVAMLCAAPAPISRAFALTLPALVFTTALIGHDGRDTRPKDAMDFFGRYRAAYRFIADRQPEGRTFVLLDEMRVSPRQGEIEGVAQVNTNATFISVDLAQLQQAIRAGVADDDGKARALALLRAVGARFLMAGPGDSGAWLDGFGLERVFTSPPASVWRDAAALPRAYVARRVVRVPAGDVLTRMEQGGIAETQAVLVADADGDVPDDGGGEATITLSEPQKVRLAVRANAPSLLVLLDAWSPDWQATVDDVAVRIRRANLVARAVRVDAGRHEVVFTYQPKAFSRGAAVSAVSVVVLVGIVLMTRDREP